MRDSLTLMGDRPRGHNRVKWPEKIAWMLAHREVWAHVVLRSEIYKRHSTSLYMRDRATWRVIANGLKDAGLISFSTGTIDVPVEKLIADAQKETDSQ